MPPDPSPLNESKSEMTVHRSRGRRPWIIISVITLTLASLLTIKLKSRWDLSRNQITMAESTRLFEKGEIERAILLLSKMLQREPNNPTVLRDLARKFKEFQRWNDSLGLWERLSKRPEATDDDRIEYAGALIKSGDDSTARKLLESLPSPVRQRTRYVELQAVLLQQEGRNQEAEKMMVEVWQRTANEPSSRLKLAELGFASLPDALRGDAGRILWEFARGSGPLSIDALVTLASFRPKATEVEEILKIINSRDDIKAANRFNILRQIIQQIPAMTDGIVNAESKRFENVSLDKRGEFYEWLASLGHSPRIIQDLSEPTSQSSLHEKTSVLRPKKIVFSSGKLFLAYADALIMSRMWDDLGAMLQNSELPLSRVEAELMLAIAAQSRQQSLTTVETHLSNALNLARYAKGTDQLWRVAHVSEKLNMLGTSLEALDLISKDHRSRFKSLVRSYQLQQVLHESKTMLQSAEAILNLKPGLQPFADEALYLGILTGLRIENASEIMVEPPDASDPKSTPLRRLAKALAAYHYGDMERVRLCLLGLNPSGLQPGPRAVMAGLMDETGNKAEGYRIAEKIIPYALMPDELWFYNLAIK